MKKEYKTPLLNISLFSGNVCTAGVSGIDDGIDTVNEALVKKGVSNVHKVSLDVFSFVN